MESITDHLKVKTKEECRQDAIDGMRRSLKAVGALGEERSREIIEFFSYFGHICKDLESYLNVSQTLVFMAGLVGDDLTDAVTRLVDDISRATTAAKHAADMSKQKVVENYLDIKKN